MNVDAVAEVMFNWEYIHWVLLTLWVLISEILYFIICKFKLREFDDGEQFQWLRTKIFSFVYGIIITTILILVSILGIAIVSSMANNPIGFIKGLGITIIIIAAVISFIYCNYKIWERDN